MRTSASSPPSVAVTAISFRPHAAAPAVLDALLPFCASLLALAFAAMLLRSFLRRRSGEKVLWGCGFLLFASPPPARRSRSRSGWSPELFRTYYLAGGVLTVAYLGAGSAWLLLPSRARDWLAGGLAVATAAAVVTVALAGVHAGTLAATAHGRPPANAALEGHAFLWAVALNSVGSLFLIGGAVYLDRAAAARAGEPLDRRRRAGGRSARPGLSRAGSYELVYAGELLGIALMFVGFAFVGKQARSRPQASAQSRVRYSQKARPA